MTRKSAPCASRPLAIPQSTGVGFSPVPSISAAMRDGILGLLSTRICRWSLSSWAGVAAISRRMKSTVASGPIPPMIPTTFSGGCIASSDVAGQLELVGIAEQPGGAAGVQEDNVAILGEESLSHLVDQPV